MTKGTKYEYPIVIGAFAFSPNSSAMSSRYCYPGSLDPRKIKNKIVLCEQMHSSYIAIQSKTVYDAGGKGMISFAALDGLTQSPQTPSFYYVPSIQIDAYSAIKIKNYIESSKNKKYGFAFLFAI